MARKPSKRGNRPTLDAELNLLPVLNLMVGLVPPLLLMASFVHLAVIDSSLPKINQEPQEQEEDPPETIPLVFTVELFEDKIRGTCTGGIPRSELKKYKGKSTCGDPKTGIVVPKKGDEYDWVAFNKKVVELKEEHPDDESVIIRPVDGVRYEAIVDAMDYTRICHSDVAEAMPDACTGEKVNNRAMDRLLFPNVNLAFSREEAGGVIQ